MNNLKQKKLSAFIPLMLLMSLNTTLCAQLTNLDELHFVADITSTLPASGTSIHSHDDAVIVLDMATNLATNSNPLGTLDQTQIDGLHQADATCGSAIYSIDTTTLIGIVAMRPADVFKVDGTKVLDSVAAGIPSGINIDAISRDPSNCDLVLSIDSATQLNNIAFKPDDLIRYTGVSNFSLYQMTGFNANIDAFHILPNGRILVSFDAGLSLPDINSKKEEVLEIVATGSTYQVLALATATLDSTFESANLNALWALPTPIIDFMFSDGFE